MRILFWSDPFWPHIGGVERLAVPLVHDLSARGHEVLVLTGQPRSAQVPEVDLAGARVARIDAFATLDGRDPIAILRLQREITELVRSFDPDLVHLFAPLVSTYFYYRIHRKIRCPILYTEQTSWFGMSQIAPSRERASPASDPLQVRALATCDWFATCADAGASLLLRVHPEARGRITTIPNGISLPEPAPSPIPPLDPPTLLCLGRLQRIHKGFDVAIAAMPAILARRPEVRMVVAGDGQDRGQLESLIDSLGLRDRVDLPGWVHPERVHEVIATSTLMLVPSRFEPFGLVAAEAGASSRACIASNVGGLSEIVADGVTGRLVPPADPGALAEATLELLADPTRLEAMGRAARQRVESRYTHTRFVDQYERLYHQLRERFPGRTHDR